MPPHVAQRSASAAAQNAVRCISLLFALSQRDLIIDRLLGWCSGACPLSVRFENPDETTRAANMVEDEEILIEVERGVVMSEARVVADAIERFHRADAGLQNAFRPLRIT